MRQKDDISKIEIEKSSYIYRDFRLLHNGTDVAEDFPEWLCKEH